MGVATAVVVVVVVGELGAVDSGLSKGSGKWRRGRDEGGINDWRIALAGEEIAEKQPVA